jgi:hypothetical protein
MLPGQRPGTRATALCFARGPSPQFGPCLPELVRAVALPVVRCLALSAHFFDVRAINRD